MRVGWRVRLMLCVVVGVVASGCGGNGRSDVESGTPTIDRDALDHEIDEISNPQIDLIDRKVYLDLPPCADESMSEAVICLDPPASGGTPTGNGADTVNALESLCSNRNAKAVYWSRITDAVNDLVATLNGLPIDSVTVSNGGDGVVVIQIDQVDVGGMHYRRHQEWTSNGDGTYTNTAHQLYIKDKNGNIVTKDVEKIGGTRTGAGLSLPPAIAATHQSNDPDAGPPKEENDQPPKDPDEVPVDPAALDALCSGRAQHESDCRTNIQKNCESPVDDNCKDPVTGEAVEADSAEPVHINCYGEVEKAECGSGEFLQGCLVVTGECPPNVSPANPDDPQKGCARAVDLNGDGVNDPGALTAGIPFRFCGVVDCNPAIESLLDEQLEQLSK
jgi:hypothetical protein